MKIALLGYGKMGKKIEEIAQKRGHEIVLRVGSEARKALTKEELSVADVVIEFSVPKAALDNIRLCFEAKVPVVVGTTGWNQSLKEISSECLAKKCTLFHSSNFSVGVNVFFAVNKFLASCMKDFEDYEVALEEVHHTEKLDAPSGTAVTLANDVDKILYKKDKWVTHKKGDTPNLLPNEFPVYYDRSDNVTGYHEVSYKSTVDKISISHEAFNREGFALGAVLASEFVANKKGIFTTSDLFKFGLTE